MNIGLAITRGMKVDYQIVVDQEGNPKSALIDWDDFLEIQTLLKMGVSTVKDHSEPLHTETDTQSEPVTQESTEYTETPTEYKDGGDYKPLAEIGVGLPKALKREVLPADKPVIPKDETEHEIKIGKRIR